MRYIVTTDRPTFAGGDSMLHLKRGDVVEVPDGERPDEDGDFYAEVVECHDADRIGSTFYIAASSLSPGSTLQDAETFPVSTILAACRALDVDGAQVVTVAKAIRDALQ